MTPQQGLPPEGGRAVRGWVRASVITSYIVCLIVDLVLAVGMGWEWYYVLALVHLGLLLLSINSIYWARQRARSRAQEHFYSTPRGKAP
jgi:uncharacterized protein (DUF58 family)